MTSTNIKKVRRIAAFSENDAGGNPAGVLVGDSLPTDTEMQAFAGAIGYSETAFAAPQGDHWRVRYFEPQSEVDFCGHATLARPCIRAGHRGRFFNVVDLVNKPDAEARACIQAELQS